MPFFLDSPSPVWSPLSRLLRLPEHLAPHGPQRRGVPPLLLGGRDRLQDQLCHLHLQPRGQRGSCASPAHLYHLERGAAPLPGLMVHEVAKHVSHPRDLEPHLCPIKRILIHFPAICISILRVGGAAVLWAQQGRISQLKKNHRLVLICVPGFFRAWLPAPRRRC
jgi:hypothetical protein